MIELARGSATSSRPPADFFGRWLDHDTWAQWSPDTEWVRVDGPVRQGTPGVLKPKGGPQLKFVVSTLEPDREYADTTRLPGARLVFSHTAARSQTGTGTALTVRVTIDGPLARLWALVLGGGFRHSAQADLDRLVSLVEAHE